MKEKLEEMVQQMRRSVKNCMRSWDAGDCVDANRIDDWADELEELLKEFENKA